MIAGALYLGLVLFSYDKVDPGWSHATGAEAVRNAGGRVGAWVSDLLLYLFGVSAYWWIALLVYAVIWGYRRLDGASLSDRRSFWVATAGFVLVLAASSSVEALRLHTLKAALPQDPGGLVGAVVSHLLSGILGFTGTTLVLLTVLGIGLSLFTGISWLTACEAVGLALERGYVLVRERWSVWQDTRAGEVAAVEREAVVEEKREQLIEIGRAHV